MGRANQPGLSNLAGEELKALILWISIPAVQAHFIG
jgi:hypothetical protein